MRFEEKVDLVTDEGLAVGQIDGEIVLELAADAAGGGGVEVGAPEDVPEPLHEFRVGNHLLGQEQREKERKKTFLGDFETFFCFFCPFFFIWEMASHAREGRRGKKGKRGERTT